MPVADALRTVLEHDGGQWMAEALATCPRYVATSLARLLPELEDGSGALGAPTTSGASSGSSRRWPARCARSTPCVPSAVHLEDCPLGRPEHPRPAHTASPGSVASTVRRDMALGRPGRDGRAHGLAQPRSLDCRGHCRRPATAHPGRDGRAAAPAHGHRGVPRPRPADPPPQSGPAAVHGAARREPGRRRAAPRPRRPARPAHRGPRRRLVASGAGAGGRSTSDAARHAPGRDRTAAGRDGRGIPPTGRASPPPTGHG